MATLNTLVGILLQFAAAHTSYEVTAERPKIVFESPSSIAAGANNSAAFAYYADDTIHLPTQCRSMATLECRAVLLHELVHYLQDFNGKLPTFPYRKDFCMGTLEREAYRVEDLYLKSRGSSLASIGLQPAWIAALTACRSPIWSSHR